MDHKYTFRYVNVGSPGRCHNAHVYHKSSLAWIVAGPTFREPTASISGAAVVPPLILGDQVFPLTPNLMKPFRSVSTPLEQKSFNYNLSKSRIVENAFGRHKARFRLVMKRMECHISNMPLVICACCTLNNICEHFRDSLPQQLLLECVFYTRIFISQHMPWRLRLQVAKKFVRRSFNTMTNLNKSRWTQDKRASRVKMLL